MADLWSAGITGMSYHILYVQCWGSHRGFVHARRALTEFPPWPPLVIMLRTLALCIMDPKRSAHCGRTQLRQRALHSGIKGDKYGEVPRIEEMRTDPPPVERHMGLSLGYRNRCFFSI